MTKGTHGRHRAAPDMEETKAHVLAAGRELLLAAQGALAFCKEYAKVSASPTSKSQVTQFFSKAMDVAEELSKGLVTASHVPGAAKGAAGQFFDAMGSEMKADAARARKETKGAKKAARTRAKPKPKARTKSKRRRQG